MDVFEKQKFFNELSFFTLCNAAPTLGKFFDDTITISNPKTEIITLNELEERSAEWVYTTISFNKGEVGNTHVFFSEDDALKLAKYAIEKKLNKVQHQNAWDEISINAVEEVMNILGGNMTEILTVVYGIDVELEVPELNLSTDNLKESFETDESLVFNNFTIHLGNSVILKMKEVAGQEYYEDLVKQLKKRVWLSKRGFEYGN